MTDTDDTTEPRTDTAGSTTPPEASPDEQSPSDPLDDGPSDSGGLPLRRLLNGLGIVLLLVAVAPFVVYAVPGVVGADASFVVLSGSMEPAIAAGDVVVVESVPPGAIAVDDVITYSRSDEAATVTHRVIDIDDAGGERVFYTKGDANEDADQRPVPASALVGAVVLTIPYIGYVIQFVGTRAGFALLVVLPFGALLVTEGVGLLRRRRGGTDADEAATERPSPPADVAAAAPHATRTDGSDPEPRPAERGAVRPPAQSTATDDAEGVAISSTDVLLTLGVLAVALPYVAFVAIERRTALSIAVAVGFGTAFALLAGVFLSARLRERARTPDRSPPPDRSTVAGDGGSVTEEER